MSFAGWMSVACLGVLVYLYLGYPAALWVLGWIRGRPVARGPITPFVSVLVPAHNEADVIETKVQNTLASDYPRDRLEVLVLCDGSTDGTGARVRALVDEWESGGSEGGPGGTRVQVLELRRGGKGRALNAGAGAARGEILVFTDANTLLATDALRRLVENFADPEVGGVCGDKRYGDFGEEGPVSRGEGAYWRYDRWVKGLESRVGSIFASDGALHAVRSDLFRPIRNPASADDMAISMRVVLQGHRLVYDRRAVVVEAPPTDPEAEFRRKIRVTNHSMRALLDLGGALWTSGLYSVQLLSHKFVRHLSPLFLGGLFVAAAGAASGGSLPFILLFAGQVAFYGTALVAHVLRRTDLARRLPVAAPYHFTLIQLAAALGIVSLLRGHRLAVWTPRGGLEPGGSG